MRHGIAAISSPVSPKAPKWPSYKGKSSFVGTSSSGRVIVFVDPTLGLPAIENAHDLVEDADRVIEANDQIFGTTGGSANVVIFALGGKTDGTGGADHMGCDYTTGADIEVCASFENAGRVSALFEAELSECSMGGHLCGLSTGEALSRWCAAQISNNALADFASAPQWASACMPDFVNQTDPTDQNAVSTGCGMAFLSWLLSQGYTLAQIAPAMVGLADSGTLAQLYADLSSHAASSAWPNFQAAVQSLSGGVSSDDPFNGMAQPTNRASMSSALAGKIFSGILANIAAGSAPEKIVGDVRAVMSAVPALSSNGKAAACRIGSRRLQLPAPMKMSARR